MARRHCQWIQTWPMGITLEFWVHFHGCEWGMCSSALPCSTFPLIPTTFSLLSFLQTANLFPNSVFAYVIHCAWYVLLHCAGYRLPLSSKFIFFACFEKIYLGPLNIYIFCQQTQYSALLAKGARKTLQEAKGLPGCSFLSWKALAAWAASGSCSTCSFPGTPWGVL